MPTSTSNQLTPEKARLITRILIFTGVALIALGLVLLFNESSPIVVGVLIFAGLSDMFVGMIILPRMLEKQMKRNDSK